MKALSVLLSSELFDCPFESLSTLIPLGGSGAAESYFRHQKDTCPFPIRSRILELGSTNWRAACLIRRTQGVQAQ